MIHRLDLCSECGECCCEGCNGGSIRVDLDEDGDEIVLCVCSICSTDIDLEWFDLDRGSDDEE